MLNGGFNTKYLARLDANQQQAVTTISGPVLVLAVPGSGKTTALVHRIGYMVYCENILPENILTLTYTVAATQDMKSRFLSLFGNEFEERLQFRTINGICAVMLNHYGKLEGKTMFQLLDSEKDAPRLVTDILREVTEEYPTEAEVKEMLAAIAYCKNMLLTDNEIRELQERWDIPLHETYIRYQRYLRDNSLMDYDDQLVYAYRILKSKTDFLVYYRKRFRYILVDEAQDTSKVQHAIIRLLAGENGNLFMVGDEDQSIYGFRAAYPEALLTFQKDFPSAKIIVMNRNYRSNANIVAAAQRLIQHNKNRYNKKMEATRAGGTEIRYIDVKSRASQYGYLVKVAQDCHRETAVLYRDNECALPQIDRMDRLGLPYRMKNLDLAFFTNRVVRDVVNIMKLALNPRDTEAFMQVYYRGFLRMRKEDAQHICELSISTGDSVLEVLSGIGYSNPLASKRAKSFVTNIRKMKTETPTKALFRIMKPMEYEDFLGMNGIGDGKVKILEMIAYSENTLGSFLKRLDYLQDMLKNRPPADSCPFILSTIHSAKGLEYDQVYLVDVYDGVLPSGSTTSGKGNTSSKDAMEEERRLFYVGVTRAKNDLNIFRVAETESVFQRELAGTVSQEHQTQNRKGQTNSYREVSQAAMRYINPLAVQDVPLSVSEKDIIIGRPVEQVKFGRGTIVDMEYSQKSGALAFMVEFEGGVEKKFLFPMAFASGNMRLVDQ